MGHLVAALLLLSFSFPLIWPAVSSDTESQLPACCRTHGKHGCSMARPSAASSGPSFQVPNKCPDYPVAGVFTSNGNTPLPTNKASVVVSFTAHPTGVRQTAARARISHSRAWYKRGPPPFIS